MDFPHYHTELGSFTVILWGLKEECQRIFHYLYYIIHIILFILYYLYYDIYMILFIWYYLYYIILFILYYLYYINHLGTWHCNDQACFSELVPLFNVRITN